MNASLIRRQDTHRMPCEDAQVEHQVTQWRQILEWCVCRTRDAKDLQPPPEARKRQGRIPPRISGGALPYRHLDFGCLVSRTTWEWISVVLIRPVCGTLLWRSRQTNIPGIQSFHLYWKWPSEIRGRVPSLPCTGQRLSQGRIATSIDNADSSVLINILHCSMCFPDINIYRYYRYLHWILTTALWVVESDCYIHFRTPLNSPSAPSIYRRGDWFSEGWSD